MKYLVGPLAFILAVLMLDRLRQIRWPIAWILARLGLPGRPSSRGDAKALYVCMYLLKVCFALAVLGVCLFTNEEWWRLGIAGVGVLANLTWTWNTRHQWSNGPPAQILSQSGDFDDRPHFAEPPNRRATDARPMDMELDL